MFLKRYKLMGTELWFIRTKSGLSSLLWSTSLPAAQIFRLLKMSDTLWGGKSDDCDQRRSSSRSRDYQSSYHFMNWSTNFSDIGLNVNFFYCIVHNLKSENLKLMMKAVRFSSLFFLLCTEGCKTDGCGLSCGGHIFTTAPLQGTHTSL